MRGDAYTGVHASSYVTKDPRHLGPRCGCQGSGKHVFKCYLFTDIERQQIFDHFWQELDWEEKKVFVTAMVESRDVKRRTKESSRRKSSLFFTLKHNGERIRVCKEFFLSTLNVGEWSLYSWLNKAKSQDIGPGIGITPVRSEKEKRNRGLVRKCSTERTEFLTSFLKSLPKMESHYCRASSSKLYLEPVWQSQSQLYREYCNKAEEAGIQPINRITFVRSFEASNLSLFSPKKDQCDVCCAYNTQSGSCNSEEYDVHLLKKELARLEKQRDKETGNVYTMDLQSVLLAPRLQASALYYKTKLCVHNFTFYNLKTKDGTCYTWHEGEGGLSANEFSSVICNFVENAASEGENITLWSDGCTYQNRNAILANGLLTVAIKKNVTIYQKFLVKGHTQMECDSMHSTIERRIRNDLYCVEWGVKLYSLDHSSMKNCVINVPEDYVDLFATARIMPRPYRVHHLDHTFFKDYSKLGYCTSIRPGTGTGDPVVTDLAALCYQPDGTIQHKLSFDEEWAPLPLRRTGRRATSVASADPPVLNQLYRGSLPIKMEKFVHLQQLKSVIRRECHQFYDFLNHVCSAKGTDCPHVTRLPID